MPALASARVLVADLEGVGPANLLSVERFAPVVAILVEEGCTELVVDDATTLTDLARERARARGIALVAAPTGGRESLRRSVRAAVIAQLGGEPPGLDAVIDRVLDELT